MGVTEDSVGLNIEIETVGSEGPSDRSISKSEDGPEIDADELDSVVGTDTDEESIVPDGEVSCGKSLNVERRLVTDGLRDPVVGLGRGMFSG